MQILYDFVMFLTNEARNIIAFKISYNLPFPA